MEIFAKEIAPYADMAREFTVNVAPYFLQMAQISAELRVYALAGEAEYVIWEVLPKTFMEEACNAQSKEALYDFIRKVEFRVSLYSLNNRAPVVVIADANA